MRINRLFLEEPFLNGGKRRRSRDFSLVRRDLGGRVHDRRQFRDRLVLEELLRREAQADPLRLRDERNAFNISGLMVVSILRAGPNPSA